MTRQNLLEGQRVRASTRQFRTEDNRDKQQRIFNVSLLVLGSISAKAWLLGRIRVEPLMEILQSTVRHKQGNRWVVWQSFSFWV